MPIAILQNFGNKKHFEASILATFRFYGIMKKHVKKVIFMNTLQSLPSTSRGFRNKVIQVQVYDFILC